MLALHTTRRTLLIAASCLLVLLSSLTLSHAGEPKWVVLDPGHGGNDNGSYWGGVREKTLTLDLAERVEKLLKAKGYNTTLTRRTDKMLSLDERIACANKFPNAVFVSIHFNAHRDRSITGIESFYHPGSSNAKRLAQSIQSSLMSRIRTRDRGIKPKTTLKVLRKTKGPATLVECGFISNSWERQRCNASWFRQILAEKIVDGITKFR
jgi:N-acetylmuramoyl-L-alanine amidase